jgi:hypothetical protein
MEDTELTVANLKEALGQREGLIAAIVALSRRNIDLEAGCSRLEKQLMTWERICADQHAKIAELETANRKVSKKVGKKHD